MLAKSNLAQDIKFWLLICVVPLPGLRPRAISDANQLTV